MLEIFNELFAGRRDVFGKESSTNPTTGKVSYFKNPSDLTLEVLSDHIKGRYGVGVYPIVNGKVKWGAVDIDGPKDENKQVLPNAWELVWQSALEQKRILTEAGLHVYIERSRSGKGAHLWVFFDDWVSADAVRKFLLNTITIKSKSPELIYPVQSNDDYGNLLALPFFGKVRDAGNASMLDDAGEVIPPKTFLETVRLNSAAVIEELAATIPEAKRQVAINSSDYRPTKGLSGALKMISPYGCRFMHNAWTNRTTLSEPEWYVAIQQATAFTHGQEFAHAISRDYKDYNPNEVNRKFEQATRQPVAGCQYIRENFPEMACPNCPGRAPYNVAEKSIQQLVLSSSEPAEKVGSFLEDIELIRDYDSGRISPGVDWGIPLLSRHNKLRDANMTIIGGWPSTGKTWLMANSAINMAQAGVLNFIGSAETARKPFRQRLLSNAAQVDLGALSGQRGTKLTRSEWAALEAADERLSKMPLYTDYTSMSPEQVLAQMEDIILRDGHPINGRKVMWFDYIQFGFRSGKDDSDREKVSRIAGEFKSVCKILNTPAVLLSQLVRIKEATQNEDPDKMPDLSLFADSSNIERTADTLYIITGQRVGGLYAPRRIWKPKDRDGVAPLYDDFILQQNCGIWKDPAAGRAERDTESLLNDFTNGS